MAIGRRTDPAPPSEARAHVSLDELVRLRHHASGFSFLPRQPVSSLLAGRHGSKLRGRGLDFVELRHYQEGDDIRAIDWLVTARQGSPHIRVMAEERDRSVLLLVDQRLSMFFGSRHAMKSVAAAEAAALAAWRVAALGDRVGAIVFSENGTDEIRPEAREPAVRHLLGIVARSNAALELSGERPAEPGLLNEALQRALRMVKHDGLVCLISDGYGADATTVDLVTRLTAHNDVLFIFVQDPLEAELPKIGRAVVAGAGEQIEADFSSSGLRDRFASEFVARKAAAASFSRERAIPVLPISTDRDVAAQLRELIGRRLGHATYRPVAGAGS